MEDSISYIMGSAPAGHWPGHGENMENESQKSSRIWLYLLPVFILAAWPAIKWTMKNSSGDVKLTKDDYGAFNAEQGELNKPAKRKVLKPELNDGEFRVRYRSAAEEEATQDAADRTDAAREKAAAAKAKADAERAKGGQQGGGSGDPGVDAMKANEQRSVGMTKGYLSYAIGKVINNPNAMAALLNNQYVINGFMSRDSVKNATSSPEALAKFLGSGSAISNFMNNAAVQAALNNPAVLNAVAGSGFMQSMLNSPAGKSLMNDPQALANLIAANPQLQGLMADPKILGLLMSDPNAATCITQMNTKK